jgi:hypothetical protein
MIFIDKFSQKVLDDLFFYSVGVMKGELAAKKHNYTLELSNSIAGTRKKRSGKKTIQVTMEEKGLAINEGYSAEHAKDRLSQIGLASYVDQLKDWWMIKKGKDEGDAEILAMATLSKHLEEGYKSRRSGQGGNTGFIDYAMSSAKKSAPMILENRDLFTVALYDELRSIAGKNIKISLKEVAGGNDNITFSRNFTNIF